MKPLDAIVKLMDMPIVGNAHHDSGLFAQAHKIIMSDKYNMTQKRFAMRRIDEAMGIQDKVTDQMVNNYIREHAD